jgi:hypothetical protein
MNSNGKHNRNHGPVFIGGLSASGKTQLRMVLGASPELSLTRRTKMWSRYYGRFGSLSDPDNRRRCFAALEADEAVRQLEPDWDRVRAAFHDGDGYARLFALLHEQYAARCGKPRWGEQLQFVECFAEPIFETFPDARLIHMVRHPETTATKPRNLGWDVAAWLYSARVACENRKRYPRQYRVVQYEALAARPEETVRDVCRFINVEYTEAMADVLASVRLPAPVIDSSDPAVSSFIDLYAHRSLTALGYEREAQPARQLLTQTLPMWPVHRLTMAAWRVTRGAPLTRQAKG